MVRPKGTAPQTPPLFFMRAWKLSGKTEDDLPGLSPLLCKPQMVPLKPATVRRRRIRIFRSEQGIQAAARCSNGRAKSRGSASHHTHVRRRNYRNRHQAELKMFGL